MVSMRPQKFHVANELFPLQKYSSFCMIGAAVLVPLRDGGIRPLAHG
jgi:hypothetical protein